MNHSAFYSFNSASLLQNLRYLTSRLGLLGRGSSHESSQNKRSD